MTGLILWLAAGAVALLPWPLVGLGASRMREGRRGVAGRVHGRSNYNGTGAE